MIIAQYSLITTLVITPAWEETKMNLKLASKTGVDDSE
ncbi:hypothetical protein B6N60_00300 [Richelia sinica FACHB-800]|uniref:Uncharacterized protein n=1 Tax=Richelia sinica FACHB-800 TaxID=1357546 RepID=A0A975T525_9NOST|nr:hypothetical protein B6N60_00300 [Richelia sinica FACHB-800]